MRVLVDEHPEALDIDTALAEVDEIRRKKALSFRFDHDRRLSLSAYLLLKRLLREEFGLAEVPRMAYGACGKPYFPDHPTINFNISHCNEAAACIVDTRPVGIDVETAKMVDEETMARVLSTLEMRVVLASSRPEVEFAKFWTRKEALVKFRGTGLRDGELKDILSSPIGVASAENVDLSTDVRECYVLTAAFIR